MIFIEQHFFGICACVFDFSEIVRSKVPLSELNAELMHLRKKFTVRNGGMRSIPKSVRNRIYRLEKVIGIKMEVYKRALEQLEQKNEISSVSQNT